MDINKTIKTELHYKDVALITVALGDYQRNCKDLEFKNQAVKLINRLGNELYSCEQDCEHPKDKQEYDVEDHLICGLCQEYI